MLQGNGGPVMSKEPSGAGLKNHEMTLKPDPPLPPENIYLENEHRLIFLTGSASSPFLPLTYILCEANKASRLKHRTATA